MTPLKTNKKTAVSSLKSLNIDIYLYILIGCLIGSCVPLKQPTFQYIDSPQLIAVNRGSISIQSTAHLNNPNKSGLWLKEMQLRVFSGGEQIGDFLQTEEVPIAGKSDFSVPFTVELDWAKGRQGLLSSALSLWQSQEIKLTFKGYAKIGGAKRGFKVPVLYTEKIKIRWK